MRRNNYTRRCKCECNKELESRYKGREKLFFDGDKCRKAWKSMSTEQQQDRLKQMEFDIKKELSRK